MERQFSNYTINKNVDRKAVNKLLTAIRKRTNYSGTVVLTYITPQNEGIQEMWYIDKLHNGKFIFNCINRPSNMFKTSLLNYLSVSHTVYVLLSNEINQYIDKKPVREMWGFTILNTGRKTKFIEVKSNDLYKHFTTNFQTGKHTKPMKEIIYCGPDDKICGFDML